MDSASRNSQPSRAHIDIPNGIRACQLPSCIVVTCNSPEKSSTLSRGFGNASERNPSVDN